MTNAATSSLRWFSITTAAKTADNRVSNAGKITASKSSDMEKS
jgi:hypothetical protein